MFAGLLGSMNIATTPNPPCKRDLFLLVFVLAVAMGGAAALSEIEQPRADALRYLEYASNLHWHGVFGLNANVDKAPSPGRENTPLYPTFLAAVFAIADPRQGELECLLDRDRMDCDLRLVERVIAVQYAIASLTLAGIWLLGWHTAGRRGAWIALAAAVASGQATEFARFLQTENFSLLFFVWFLYAALRSIQAGAGWGALSGASLGGLVLARPEFLYLVYFLVVALGLWLWRTPGSRERSVTIACGIAMMAAVGVPWIVRNAHTFGDPALTETYGGRIIAQRVQYNRMSPEEIAVSFIYWLPDFGDSVSERLFSPRLFERLDFGPGSYYKDGNDYYQALLARQGGKDGITSTIIAEEVLAKPFKHAAVTAALAWRALFVGKLWGLVALVVFIAALVTQGRQRRMLWLLGVPGLFMVCLYAAVSVSIPRYAICMLPAYSVAFALLFTRRTPQ